MIAHFYILAESFANNANFISSEIEYKIKRLSEDICLINTYKLDNKLYINYQDLYPQKFYEDYTLEEFICNSLELKNNGVDRDIINSVQNIVNRAETTTITSAEVVEFLLEETDENECHGLIAFNNVENLNIHHQVIYGADGWYTFRRYFLGLYPKNANFYITECKKYFPDIIFHDRNKAVVGDILNNFSKKIIYHLSALNDRFIESQDGIRNRTEVLNHFSINCALDTIASLEGNAKRKKYFTFDFVQDSGDEAGTPKMICCEPHIKLSKSDISGDNTFYQHRIYFYEGDENIQNGKILIGHIGNHL